MSERFYLSLLAVGFACVVTLAPFTDGVTAAGARNLLAANGTETKGAPGEAERALAEGTAHLRRNRADLALPLLESALKLFTGANNRSGLAATHAALGDIYLRHGQYAPAIEHFSRAAEAFRAQHQTANAALMFAKLGETYYLSGDEASARAAFARIGEGEKEHSAAGAASGGGARTSGGSGRRNNAGGGAFNLSTFASMSALLPDACSFALPADGVSPLVNSAANIAANSITPGGNNSPVNPARNPSGSPSNNATGGRPNNPTGRPSTNPSNNATGRPSGNLSNNPANNPTSNPTNNPTSNPSNTNPNNPGGNSTGSSSGSSPNNPSANTAGKQANNSPGNSANNPSNNASSNPSGNSPNNPSNSPSNNLSNNPSGNSANNPSGNSSGNSSNNPSNNSANNPSGNSAKKSPNNPSGNSANKPSGKPSGNEPSNMGRAPKKLDDLGRMDLRVFDEQGNPVKGAKARLSTTRPNGIFCDCVNETNAAGRAVLPAIHVGKELKLEVTAPGFEPLEQIVPPEQLAAPFKVTLQTKNAANSIPQPTPKQKFAHAAAPPRRVAATPESASQLASSAANTLGRAISPNASGACFDFYRLFIAYATRELTLARADFNNNRLDSAQAHYLNVLAAADKNSQAGSLAAARLFRAVSRTSLGDIALRQSRFADALKFYGQAAEIARQDGRAELTWGAERGLGKTYWVMAAVAADDNAAAKNRNDALKHYRAALGIIETLFAGSLRADDARSNFLATTKDVFDEAAGALAELALMNASPAPALRRQASAHASNANAAPTLEGQSLTYAAEAFRIVEQGKARSLLDMLGDARAEVREGVPAALLERKAANMARQQEIAYLFGGVNLQGSVPPQNVAELEAELERLTVEFNSLENQIRTSSPRYAALVRAQPLTLAEVQRQVLDDSTALLEYNLGTHQSYLFAATKNGLTLYRLPSRTQIERLAVELRQQLVPAGSRRAIAGINVESTTRGLTLGAPSTAPANVNAYTAAANALYKTVVAPAIAQVGDRRLLVVPDGALNYVPFESLVASTGGTDYSTLAYLIKTNEIVYAPSASVVAVIRQGARRDVAGRDGAGMLLVADPVFDAGDPRLKSSSLAGAARARESVQRMSLASALSDVTNLKSNNLKLVRLDGTRSEAEEIAKLARANGSKADVWLDFDANEANLHGRRLDNYRVLHFATHGLLDADRPQFTGLALSLVGQTDADGYLRVDEV
ncbi:MAG TPA: CHAT domain-containing protein, partial [Pyrinomonadaceae bacterium]